MLLRGLAVRLADGYTAAAPLLSEALRRYRAQPQELDWLCVACNMVAMDLWDDQAWFELATGQVGRARANGTLSWLPFALDYLAEMQIQAGELSAADGPAGGGRAHRPGDQGGHPPVRLAAARRVARGRAGRGRADRGR